MLIATHWIEAIQWADRRVCVKLTCKQIKDSPAYRENEMITRAYEERLRHAYGRHGYRD